MPDKIDEVIGRVLRRRGQDIHYAEFFPPETLRAVEFWIDERPGRVAAVELVAGELYVRGRPRYGDGFDLPDVVTVHGAAVRVLDFLFDSE